MKKILFDSIQKMAARLFPFLDRSGKKGNPLNDLQKTAVFFLSLPPDSSARLIGTLSSHEINTLTMEMCQMSSVAQTAQKEVWREFCEILLEEGKLPQGTEPTRDVVRYIADRDPKGIVGIIRRHWLTPKLPSPLAKEQKEVNEKVRPEERVAILLSHIPASLVRKILPQLSPEELSQVGRGMLETSSIPDLVQQQVWGSLSRWFRGSLDDQDSILKGIHHLLRDESPVHNYPPLDYMEKAILLLRFLRPREKEIGKKVMEHLERPEQEAFIFSLRQVSPDLPEREKKQVVEEFLSFVKVSFAPHSQVQEEELLQEVEEIGLHRPREIAECLEAHWLGRKSSVIEWREMAEKHPLFAAQKLAAFMQLKGKKWETLGSVEKCAIFLRLLHPEIRSEVLSCLSEKNRNLLSYETSKLPFLPAWEKRALLEEFVGQYYYQSTTKLLESGS